MTNLSDLIDSLPSTEDIIDGVTTGHIAHSGTYKDAFTILNDSLQIGDDGTVNLNGGFTKPYDTDLWIAGATRVDPPLNSQGIYVQHRINGDLSDLVHDASAFELRAAGVYNASYMNALEASVVVSSTGNDIPDIRAITANLHTSGTPDGTITQAVMIAAQQIPPLTGTVTVATAISLLVESQIVGATNYTIYAPAGKTVLGDTEARIALAVVASSPLLNVDASGTTHGTLGFKRAGVNRWLIRTTGTESGGNTGTSLEIVARTDAGGSNATVMSFSRDTLAVTIGSSSGRLGFFGGTAVSKRTGWAVATGTATRTTFATGSVTLPELAERVKALIDDLHATAGYGLLNT